MTHRCARQNSQQGVFQVAECISVQDSPSPVLIEFARATLRDIRTKHADHMASAVRSIHVSDVVRNRPLARQHERYMSEERCGF